MINHNLKLFLAVVESGSITVAAQKLYISQPAISQAIKSLEKELNVKLFHRNGKQGIVLTHVGEQIYKIAQEMQHLEDQLYQTAYQENHFLGGRLRIGSLPILTTLLLPEPLCIFRKNHPAVTVELVEGTPSELREMIENHSLDFALSCSPFGNLDHQVVVVDKMVGILPAGDMADEIDLRKVTGGLILVKAAAQTVNEELQGRFHFDFSESVLTSEADSVVSLVKAGNGRGIISQFTLDVYAPKMKRVPVLPEIKIEIGIECRDFDDLTPVAREFIRIIKETHRFSL